MSDYNSSLPIRTENAGDVIAFIADPTTPANRLKVNVDGSINAIVEATAFDIRPLDNAIDSVSAWLKDEAGNAFSSANPLPVEFFESLTEANSYNTANVASAGASNHDYTTTGAFKLHEVIASASGKLKAELQIETAPASGTYNTVAVGFNSTSNANIIFQFAKGLSVVSGAKVRIIRTNRDNQAMDVYSTVVGVY